MCKSLMCGLPVLGPTDGRQGPRDAGDQRRARGEGRSPRRGQEGVPGNPRPLGRERKRRVYRQGDPPLRAEGYLQGDDAGDPGALLQSRVPGQWRRPGGSREQKESLPHLSRSFLNRPWRPRRTVAPRARVYHVPALPRRRLQGVPPRHYGGRRGEKQLHKPQSRRQPRHRAGAGADHLQPRRGAARALCASRPCRCPPPSPPGCIRRHRALRARAVNMRRASIPVPRWARRLGLATGRRDMTRHLVHLGEAPTPWLGGYVLADCSWRYTSRF
mmetsp:Transcript_39701/g.63662  ORF Transcript_39701/g.63662 Transcript_39701/m.63662 type:complete len:273 (+) Transcript_39701:55-873(+)